MAGVNETVVEVVRFQAAGLDEIGARTKAYAEQVDEAQKRAKALAGLLNDPAYARHAQTLTTIQQHHQRMAIAVRNQQLAQQAATGQLQRHMTVVLALNRQHDITQAKIKNQVAAADLASGAYYRHARAMAAVNREAADIAKQQQLQGLVAQHGRVGGVMRHHQGEVQTIRRAGTVMGLGATGLTMGLMRSGLQGTVEAYKMEMAWMRLSRQVAAIAIPVFDKIASVVGRIAGWFEKLSGNQQDWILKLGLVALAFGPVVRMATTLYSVVRAAGVIMGGMAVASRLAVAGAAVGATGGIAAGGMAAGAAAGGTGAAVGGAVAGGVAARGLGARAMSTAKFAATRALPAAAAAYAIHQAVTSENDYYDYQRSMGRNMLISGIQSAAYNIGALFEDENRLDPRFATWKQQQEDKKKKRDVTYMNTSLMSVGESHQAIQEEVLKHTAARDDHLGFMADTLKDIKSLIEKLGGDVGWISRPPVRGT